MPHFLKFILVPLLFLFLSCSATTTTDATEESDTTAALTVSQTDEITVGSTLYYSSSKLAVTWEAVSGADHYLITAADEVQSTTVTATALSSATSASLTKLKAQTDYTITVKACADAACLSFTGNSQTGTGETPKEVWQFAGSGNGFENVDPIVSDGNVTPYAFTYGDSVGGTLAGKVQLYYNPGPSIGRGVKVVASDDVASDADSVGSFDAATATYSFKDPPTAATYFDAVKTYQAVPLSAAMGAKIRMFMEAVGADGENRIMSIDSQDGYTGEVFNASADVACETTADYNAGGGCEPTVLLGVAGDADHPNPEVAEIAQLKVGYPVLTDWLWDGSAGTFMVVTFHLLDDSSCNVTGYKFKTGLASFDGNGTWDLAYDDGCPRAIEGVQAPAPVHRGDAQYKMYFSNNTDAEITDPSTWDNRPFKMLYADGAASGTASIVEFDDWESVDDARDIDLIWPDGSAVSLEDESKLDDYTVYWPTFDSELQVMYSNVEYVSGNNNMTTRFIGMAVLVNP